jgi:hypothetical protein
MTNTVNPKLQLQLARECLASARKMYQATPFGFTRLQIQEERERRWFVYVEALERVVEMVALK